MSTFGLVCLVLFPGKIRDGATKDYCLTPWWVVLVQKGLRALPSWLAEFRAKKVEVMKKELAVLENVEVGEQKVSS